MRIRTILQASIIIAVIASATLAQASQVWVCTGPSGPNCYTVCYPNSCSWEPGQSCEPPSCELDCDPVSGSIDCKWVEQPTTPVKVYQEVNVLNAHHQYRTDMLGGLPFWTPQGSGFSLANDSAYGGIPFGLTSGSGYYFRNANAVPNLVPLYYYTNPATGDYVFTVDWNYGHSLPCPSPQTGNCYFPAGFCDSYGVFGYVGRP